MSAENPEPATPSLPGADVPSVESAPVSSTPPPIPFHMGEEMSAPSKKLPPMGIVLIGVTIILAIAGVFSFVQRPHSQTTGSIDMITTADVAGQGAVMVAINVSISNPGEKTYYIHEIGANLETASGSFSDTAASAVDFDRYYTAFPQLKRAPLAPLLPEQKIAPGQTARGTIIVLFPVTEAAFNSRKAMIVKITPYDQPVPLVMTERR